MAGLLSALGGTLAGIGQGMTDQAAEDGKAKREARLMELQHGYRMTEMGAQQQFQAGEAQKGRDFQAGQSDLDRKFRTGEREASQTFQASESEKSRGFQAGQAGADRAFRAGEAQRGRDWERERLGIANEQQTQRDERQFSRELEKIDRTADAKARARRDLYGDTSGLNADDQRQFKALDGLYGDDPEKMRQALAASGNPRLAALAQGGGQGGSGSSAAKKAQMSADDKRVYDSVVERYTDPMLKKTDWGAVGRDLQAGGRDDLAAFAFGSPDPQGWERLEIPKDLRPPARGGSGGGSPANRAQTGNVGSPVVQPSSAGQPAGNPPSGKGTQAEPFQAASQADIEWFKNLAPKGAVIVVNGKPYVK
ncbi:hypothetical protein J2847_004145 [Azospirillum agricola]|uniref:hypothetical protein n=1 Tax=Azospirillum agricola TaxID=1720247 RepID=UPI001AE5C45E|nr:hypothetical protein [Azospirillum agricola]MBP2230836.1 hypothetical protein [Azospirillum agricola]